LAELAGLDQSHCDIRQAAPCYSRDEAQNAVMEIFEAVAELDAVCARLCALKMSVAERHRFEELHRRCGELVRSSDSELHHAANADFHAAIRQGSHNAMLEVTAAIE
jgi:DNA-binding GntR family transcriptional regulator